MFFQSGAQILLFLFSATTTPTTGGLETLFQQSSILFLTPQVVLGLSIALSMKSAISLHVKSVKTKKQYFPTTSKTFVVLWGLFATLRRILGIVAFFIPSMGLCHLLNHVKFEQVAFKIRLDYVKTIDVEDKIALYGMNETIYWTELDRWDYSNPDKPSPPDYSIYTGLNLKETFVAFFGLMALQFIAIICVKMGTSRSFRAKSDIFNKFLHSLQNLNLNFPYEDWDDGRYSLEEFQERHRSVTKEMAASFALTFVFSLISLCPVWYTGDGETKI